MACTVVKHAPHHLTGSCCRHAACREASAENAAASGLSPLPPGHGGSRLATPNPSRVGQDLSNHPDTPAAEDGEPGTERAKPFLKRRTQKVVGARLDWSHVQSRTKTHLDDNYVLPRTHYRSSVKSSPSASARKNVRERTAPSPTGRMLAYSPLPPKAGGARARASGIRTEPYYAAADFPRKPGTPAWASPKRRAATAMEDYAAAQGYDVLRQPLSFRPGEVPDKFSPTSQLRHSEVARSMDGGVRGSGRMTRRGYVTDSPLDDLLVHVNGLISEFDRKFKGKPGE